MAKRPTLARRINMHFAAPEVLIYVLAHASVDSPPPSPVIDAHFTIGQFFWYSYPTPATVASPTTHFNVQDLVYPLNYGETGDPNRDNQDPPKMVWMDSCNTMGAAKSNFEMAGDPVGGNCWYPTTTYTDHLWSQCFGIDYVNGLGGTMVGWSGAMLLPGSGNKWDTWRDIFWSQLFLNSQNVQTSVTRANHAVQGSSYITSPTGQSTDTQSAMDPEDRVRFDGDGTTGF